MTKEKFFETKIGHITLGIIIIGIIALVSYMVVKHIKAKAFEDRKKLGKLLNEQVSWNAEQKKYVETFSKSGRLADMVLALKYAPGKFSDDEGKVYTIFTELKNSTELEALRGFFQKQVGQNLFSFLSDFMNDKELANVYGLVKGLKPYKK